MVIVGEVYKAVGFLPDTEKYGLRSQAASIPSNIVEGSAKKSQKEYRHFVEISLGSAFELETHLINYSTTRMGFKGYR